MNPLLTNIKTLGRAAIVAAVLGAGGLAAATPAMAQSGEPSFNFNLGIQNGQPSMGLEIQGGNNNNNTFRHGGGGGGGDFRICLNDRQVIHGLRDYGFSRVEIVDSSRRRAQVIARYGRYDYLMRVDKCSGEVNIIERYRRGRGNGFGLQFNFGN